MATTMSGGGDGRNDTSRGRGGDEETGRDPRRVEWRRVRGRSAEGPGEARGDVNNVSLNQDVGVVRELDTSLGGCWSESRGEFYKLR